VGIDVNNETGIAKRSVRTSLLVAFHRILDYRGQQFFGEGFFHASSNQKRSKRHFAIVAGTKLN
jgi:hypothetical protein